MHTFKWCLQKGGLLKQAAFFCAQVLLKWIDLVGIRRCNNYKKGFICSVSYKLAA